LEEGHQIDALIDQVIILNAETVWKDWLMETLEMGM
jgi:hypothetical protein